MIISEDRQSYLARFVIDGLWKDQLIDFKDEGLALRKAKEAFAQWVKEEDNIDDIVKQKVSSLKRNVIEGSPEWDVMYRKYYEDEVKKRG